MNFALDSHDLSPSRRKRKIPDNDCAERCMCLRGSLDTLPLPEIVAKKREEKAANRYKEEHERNKGYEWKEKEKKM